MKFVASPTVEQLGSALPHSLCLIAINASSVPNSKR